ncbi:hypothetical protein [Alloyangia pacifica]|uniref:Uncharacterized protein n=1 Tax=Alloyangia pacifica TaxID=311180 RepID=A0A1I6RTN1_9RHOB|nr:hypothetical protein [Alloyangia pacifica]SDG60334.1 hypothetical protein SAMN04488245_103360 [Alloyangia pacifica]SFS68083.1 hypothetical protein SAMN04488050_103404 [Alloyangia pacifica]
MSMADPRRGAAWQMSDMRIFEEKKPTGLSFACASSLFKYAQRDGAGRAALVGGPA